MHSQLCFTDYNHESELVTEKSGISSIGFFSNTLLASLMRQLCHHKHNLKVPLASNILNTAGDMKTPNYEMSSLPAGNVHCCLEMRDQTENLLFSCCHRKNNSSCAHILPTSLKLWLHVQFIACNLLQGAKIIGQLF